LPAKTNIVNEQDCRFLHHLMITYCLPVIKTLGECITLWGKREVMLLKAVAWRHVVQEKNLTYHF